MNYLAHLHIAEHTKTSLLGNFLGDFIKGNPNGKFNEAVVRGIRLHRFVDSYTDNHVLVTSSKPLFEKSLRRFSPIALDMFWDHCLAKHWEHFHCTSLSDFSIKAEKVIAKEMNRSLTPLPAQFNQVSALVWKGRWFEHYAEIKNIDFALQRIALRRERMAPLAETFATLKQHYQQLTDTFFELYPDILNTTLIETKMETKESPF